MSPPPNVPTSGGYPPPPGGDYPPSAPTSGGYPPPPGGDYQPPSSGAPYASNPAAAWSQPPTSGAPTPGPYGPGAPLGPATPPKKGGGGKVALIIGLVVVVLLCVCGGVAVWGFTSFRNLADSVEDASDLPTGLPTFPTSEPTPSPSESSGDEDLESATAWSRGDCLKNEGTDSDPELKKVPCGKGTDEVLAVIPFTADPKRCDVMAPDADGTYTYDSTRNFNDFVLCLKSR